ncbi:MAG TPA: GFA family protein [Gaiellales bacterium]
MGAREAACSCGQLRLTATGEPFATGICHCLACQRRTGTAFGMQAGYSAGQVQVSGRSKEYARTSDEADRRVHVFHFCPECGSTVFYTEPDEPELVVVMTGAFADPSFPAPTESGYTARRHRWVELPEEIQRDDAWDELRPLYEAGDFSAVADRGRELVDAHPDDVRLAYNIACCESRAGRTADAIEHLRRAIDRHNDLRSLAAGDSDFDPIRGEPAFTELIGSA